MIRNKSRTKEETKIKLNITELDKDSLIFLIRGLFIKAYDEITLSFDKTNTSHHRLRRPVRFLAVIHNEIARSIGYEIIQERGNFVTIKKISESTMKEFDSMLKRTFLIILDASKDLYLGVKARDFELIKTLEDKHDTTTKFIGYNLRILNSVDFSNYKNINFLFHIISSLDMILDILRNTARDIIADKIIPSKDCVNIFHEIQKAIEIYYDLYYNFTMKKFEKFSEARDNILHSINKLQKKLSKADVKIIVGVEHTVELFRVLSQARIALEY